MNYYKTIAQGVEIEVWIDEQIPFDTTDKAIAEMFSHADWISIWNVYTLPQLVRQLAAQTGC